MGVPLPAVAAALPLGDFRPHWTRLAPWWDAECDAHLVLGTARHG